MIIFSDSRDPIFNSRNPNQVPETPQKNLLCYMVYHTSRKLDKSLLRRWRWDKVDAKLGGLIRKVGDNIPTSNTQTSLLIR